MTSRRTHYWYKFQPLRLRLMELAYGSPYWTRHYQRLRRLCMSADTQLLRTKGR